MMSKRIFKLEDNLLFGKLSGDINPVHVDPHQARRTLFGYPVVHGIHLVLWGLEKVLRKESSPIQLKNFKARFQQALVIDQEVTCHSIKVSEEELEIQLKALGRIVSTINCSWEKYNLDAHFKGDFPPIQTVACKNNTLESLPGISGNLPLFINLFDAKKTFPKVSGLLPPIQLACLLGINRLIGMECPGLNSILLKIDIEFANQPVKHPNLLYTVKSSHPVTGRTEIALQGEFLKQAKLIAGYRPNSPSQESFDNLKNLVNPSEFKEQRGIILGGSRGLGELTAKILAAGGASVCLSYSTGAQDAQRVSEEINSGGGKAIAFHYDMTDYRAELKDLLPPHWQPTQLYHFATPHISLNDTTEFVNSLFYKYCEFYVGGFYRLVKQVSEFCPDGIAVFYPSSVALEGILPKASEYASAKAAGEMLCNHLEKIYPKTRIIVLRLPRMITDQTVSLMPAESADSCKIMLEIIRRMQ